MRITDLPVPYEDGHFISERIGQIVELIKQYDYRLDVKWIPPGAREPGDAAFAIFEHTPKGTQELVFYVQTEEEFDERVLKRIYEGDVSKNDVEGRVEAHNRATRDLRKKQYDEIMAEQSEIAAAVIRSPKDNYRVGKKVFRAESSDTRSSAPSIII